MARPTHKNLAILLTLAIVPSVQAVDFDWTGAVDSDWLNGANWTPTGPPTGGAGNFARFFTGTTRPAEITANVGDVQDVLFDNNGTLGLRVVNHNAGSLNQTGWHRMGTTAGSGDAGTYNLAGTGVFSAGRLQVGEATGTSAAFSVAGTSTATIRELVRIGDGGTGTYTQTGGTLEFSTGSTNFSMHVGTSGTGNFTMSGGTFRQATVGDQNNQDTWNQIGVNGGSNATFNLSGGLVSLDARTFLGRNGTATFNQTGGTLEIRRGEVNVGDSGTSIYNLSGGTLRTLNVNSLMTIGQWDNGNGTVNVSGTGSLDVAGRLFVGAGQDPVTTTGKIVQTGGTVNAGRQLLLGDSNLAVGTYNLDAGNVTFATAPQVPVNPDNSGGENGNFVLGNRGDGTMTMTGGSLRQVDVVDPERTGNWNHIGQSATGTGVFNLSGGVASFDSRTHLGFSTGSTGTVNQTGGTFEIRRHELIIADSGTGTYNISSGVLQSSRGINVGNWNGSVGNFNVSGTGNVAMAGNLIIGQAENNTFNASGTVTQTGGTVTVGENILFGQNSTGAAGTYNLNGGVLDLTGGNIQRGPGTSDFNMNGGTLRNVASIIGDSLDGAFTLQSGLLEVGALAGPGGVTTINGNFSLLAAGTVKFEIDNAASDLLAVNGTLNLTGGTLDIDELSVLPGGGFTLIANDDVDPVIGTFANAPNGVPFTQDGKSYTVFYNAGDGNDVLIVPEPTISGSVAAAVICVGLLRRSRRKK